MRAWVAAAALCAVALGGCNRSRKKVIAVVPKATSHTFWVSVEAGARAAGRDLDVDVLWNGPAQETEYDRQIQIVDSMVARHVDGLALAATERKALVGPVGRAMAAGIPVTIFDSGLDSENYMTFLATNNYEAGQMAARELARLLGGRGKVGIVLHAPGSLSTMDRERGFEDAMTKEFPQVRIVARQYGMSSRAKSRDAAENILTATPDLDGLFASTEPSAAGAALAIKSRGLAGKVKFIAFDASESMVADLRAGLIHAMVVQDPFRIGYESVKTLVDKLHGKQPPKHIDLSARVVRAVDLDKPEIHALLFPDLKKGLQ
ncbi:MAG: substrate-binding domain-containing protein [Acidobacteriota bacterium]